MLENALGFILALFLVFYQRKDIVDRVRDSKLLSQCLNVMFSICDSFYDSAIFLTFSIQIASIVVLVRLNFGVSANGMGDITARITWAVSLLTMLPLTYVAYISSPLQEPGHNISIVSASMPKNGSSKNRTFALFVVCWLLSVYPFLSRMISTFVPGAIGSGNTKIISENNWAILEASCLSSVSVLTDKENTVIDVLGVAGSLFVSLLTIVKILWLAMLRQHADSRLTRVIRKRFLNTSSQGHKLGGTLLVAIPIFAIGQIWTIFRLRSLQTQISRAAGNSDVDGEWTFGQVVAVTVFFPVLVEAWSSLAS